jgi:hypothetical protein
VSRRILVRVAPDGALTVEAEGFQGKGCEAATQAIEQALGKKVDRALKPEHRQSAASVQQQQSLGGGS